MKTSRSGCDVSVVIPTFNRIQCLPRALDSVFAQSQVPQEIIVVDDGSEDNTGPWLAAQNHPKLKIFHQVNRGPAAARNLGAQYASGKYLAFLDSDDYWEPEKLAVQTTYMEANPSIGLCQTEEIWIRHGVRVNPMKKHRKPSGDVFIPCLKLCLISPSAVMLRRKFFQELGGFDINYPVCEDYELWLRATLRRPVVTLEQALTIKMGGHEDQLSRKYWGMDRFRIQALEKTLASETLKPQQKKALIAELREKLSIMSSGFAKRKPQEENPYQKRLACL